MTPIGRYVRGKLHRRLFFLLGGSIAFTVLVVAVVFHFTSDTGAWGREVERVRAFTGGRFERAWDTKVERDELARSIARDLDVDVALTDSTRTDLGAFGDARSDVPVQRGGHSKRGVYRREDGPECIAGPI